MGLRSPFDILRPSAAPPPPRAVAAEALSAELRALLDPESLSVFLSRPPQLRDNLICGPIKVSGGAAPFRARFDLSSDAAALLRCGGAVIALCVADGAYCWPRGALFAVNGHRFAAPLRRLPRAAEGFWLSVGGALRCGANEFAVESNGDQSFHVALRLFAVETNAALARRVCAAPHTGIEHWARLFRAYLSDSSDAIMSNNTCLSLLCPIGLQRITDAVRGAECAHIACFDLITYLRLARECGQWRCPICCRSCEFEDLRCDDVVQDIIDSVPQNCESVIVNEKGQFIIDKLQSNDDYSE